MEYIAGKNIIFGIEILMTSTVCIFMRFLIIILLFIMILTYFPALSLMQTVNFLSIEKIYLVIKTGGTENTCEI